MLLFGLAFLGLQGWLISMTLGNKKEETVFDEAKEIDEVKTNLERIFNLKEDLLIEAVDRTYLESGASQASVTNTEILKLASGEDDSFIRKCFNYCDSKIQKNYFQIKKKYINL